MLWLKQFFLWLWTGKTLTDSEVLDYLNKHEQSRNQEYIHVVNMPGLFVPVIREYTLPEPYGKQATLDLVYISSHGKVYRLEIIGIDDDLPKYDLPYELCVFLNMDEDDEPID